MTQGAGAARGQERARGAGHGGRAELARGDGGADAQRRRALGRGRQAAPASRPSSAPASAERRLLRRHERHRPRAALAGAALRRLARHRRDAAALDPDRRQGPARAHALAQPRLARAALRHRARPRHARRSTSAAALVEIEFDLVDHRLVVRARPSAAERGFALAPMSVAAFYRRVMAELAAAGVEVAINVVPNEMADPIPFPEDTRHAAYDAAAAHAVLARAGAGRPRLPPVPHRLPRQGEPGAFLLGRLRPRGDALLRPAGAAASGRHPRPARRGDARGLLARGQQRRLLARQRRLSAGRVLFVRLSDADRLRARPSRAAPARVWSKEMGEWLLPYEAVRSRRRPRRGAAALPADRPTAPRPASAAGIRRSSARSVRRAGRGRSAADTRAGSARQQQSVGRILGAPCPCPPNRSAASRARRR